jgi:hypothetical protein
LVHNFYFENLEGFDIEISVKKKDWYEIKFLF